MSEETKYICDACQSDVVGEPATIPYNWCVLHVSLKSQTKHACSHKCAAAILRAWAHWLDPVKAPELGASFTQHDGCIQAVSR